MGSVDTHLPPSPWFLIPTRKRGGEARREGKERREARWKERGNEGEDRKAGGQGDKSETLPALGMVDPPLAGTPSATLTFPEDITDIHTSRYW